MHRHMHMCWREAPGSAFALPGSPQGPGRGPPGVHVPPWKRLEVLCEPPSRTSPTVVLGSGVRLRVLLLFPATSACPHDPREGRSGHPDDTGVRGSVPGDAASLQEETTGSHAGRQRASVNQGQKEGQKGAAGQDAWLQESRCQASVAVGHPRQHQALTWLRFGVAGSGVEPLRGTRRPCSPSFWAQLWCPRGQAGGGVTGCHRGHQSPVEPQQPQSSPRGTPAPPLRSQTSVRHLWVSPAEGIPRPSWVGGTRGTVPAEPRGKSPGHTARDNRSLQVWEPRAGGTGRRRNRGGSRETGGLGVLACVLHAVTPVPG